VLEGTSAALTGDVAILNGTVAPLVATTATSKASIAALYTITTGLATSIGGVEAQLANKASSTELSGVSDLVTLIDADLEKI
jgi:hypothetical protein